MNRAELHSLPPPLPAAAGSADSPWTLDRRRWITLALLFLVAVVPRALYLAELERCELADYLSLDTETNQKLALRVAEEGSTGERVFFRAPGYPYLVGMSYRLFGSDLAVPRIIQMLLGSLVAPLTYLLALRFVSPRGAVAAGLACALYWPLIYFGGELLAVSWRVPLDLLALLLMVWRGPEREPSRGLALAAGLTLGLAAVIRPTNLVFVPFAILWLEWVRRRGNADSDAATMRERLLRPSVLLALGAGAALSPVTLHNWVRGNDPLLVASQGGINFYLGNNPEANGRSARAPVNWEEIPAEYRERHRDDVWSDRIVWASARYLAGKDLEREALRDSEISRYWFRKGLRFVWEDPLGFARLLLAKSYFLLNAYEIPSNKDMEFFIEDQRLGVLQALSLGLPSRFPAGVLLPLALLGVLFSWRQRSRWSLPYLFLVSQALVIVLFFVTARFRLPMVPLLALFAVAGVVGTIQAVNRGSTARRIGVAALALGLLALSQSRALQVRDPHLLGTLRYNLGNHYRERGQMERAEAAYLAAVEMAPELAVASYQLGNIHFDRREMDRAETRYRAALEARPTLSDALLNLGLVLQFRGDLPAAVEALRAGLRLQPDSTQGRFNLAVLLVEMDEPEEAAQQYAEALRLDPSYWAAAINLGNLRFRQGDYESALRAYEEALRQLPRNAQLHHDVGVTLSRLGRFEEAEASLRAALRLDPLRTETLRELSALRPRER